MWMARANQPDKPGYVAVLILNAILFALVGGFGIGLQVARKNYDNLSLAGSGMFIAIAVVSGAQVMVRHRRALRRQQQVSSPVRVREKILHLDD